MSAPTEPAARRGVVLLVAIVITSVLAVCVVALWRNAARVRRAAALELGGAVAAMMADSAALAAVWSIDSGAWRALASPGDTLTLLRRVLPRGHASSALARVGWSALLVRGTAVVRSGVPSLPSAADTRIVIPLVPPVPMPVSPLTGANLWSVDPLATVLVPVAGAPEVRCRPAGVGAAVTRQPFPAAFDARRFTALDPDTVTDSLTGSFRLTRAALTRPLQVTGMLVTDSGLVVGSDLRVTGIVVIRGSVRPGGGRLLLTGAVVAGDAGGGTSALGPADQVRYDACAVRRALAPQTHPGPSASWTHFRLF